MKKNEITVEALSRLAAGEPPSNLGYDHEEVIVALSKTLLASKNQKPYAWDQARAAVAGIHSGITAPAQFVIPEQQQPIAYIFKHPAGRLFWSLTDESNKWQADVIPVYAEPHELKIPPAIEPDYEVIKGILPTANPDEYACCIAADMWNACRAEMLKAQQNEPQNIPENIPENIATAHSAYISFDALMAAVSEVTGAKSEFDATPEKCYQAVPFMNFNSLSRIVEMFRTAQPVSEPYKLNCWISVADRLPSEFGRYLCYVEEQNDLGKSHYQWNCSWNGDVFSDSSLTGRVTHWMPLPEAPEQESE
ncbi:DUF551 domain-containing protein [Hafnia alvei]|uniref:DUF551 domain-containing protein n=1 Tax=Hafnia alvei TaxID=569 RepID=UPI002DBA25BF|nr:DUF551 domain-containing protein [Hafnia alvei]MEB7891013.1 DUF551 domain-containing protein [Hafnia alvei]